MGRPAPYHKLSVQEKLRETRTRIRPNPARCPRCEAGIPAPELLNHIRERCPGEPPIHRHEPWVTWSRALEIGMDRVTLHRHTLDRTIRSRPKNQGRGREYLESDIFRYLARREVSSMKRRGGGGRCR